MSGRVARFYQTIKGVWGKLKENASHHEEIIKIILLKKCMEYQLQDFLIPLKFNNSQMTSFLSMKTQVQFSNNIFLC